MSREARGAGVEKIDVGALATQIQLLREQANALQAYLQQLLRARDSVARAIDSVKALEKVEGSMLVYLDPNMNIAITVNPLEKDRMLVHLGLNIYARLGAGDALKILEERRAKLNKAVEETGNTINNIVSLHDQYQAVLQRVLAQASGRG